MKHLLPVLTLALLGAVSTVSAGAPYTEETFLANDKYTEKYDKAVSASNNVYEYDAYTVTLKWYSYLKIQAKQNIKLFVYDFVDTVQDGVNASALTGTSEKSGPVQLIGYREIDSTGTPVASSENIHALGPSVDPEIVNRVNADQKPIQVVRNSYYLGEFKAGKDYELFVSYTANPSDGKWSYTDHVGGYDVQADKLMMAYLSESFQTFADNAGVLAQEYTHLVQVNNKSFGLRSETIGSPLPGGVQIALIAGVFGLGFWYVRRRKATVA